MQNIFVILICGIFTACTNTSTQYYWGQYEPILYDMYLKPGKATPEVQIELLTTDIQKAEDIGKPIPPGIHAHLGTMYAATGNVEQALAAFNQEKDLYPESHILIDGMIERSMNSKKNP